LKFDQVSCKQQEREMNPANLHRLVLAKELKLLRVRKYKGKYKRFSLRPTLFKLTKFPLAGII